MEIKEHLIEEWRPVVGHEGLYEVSNLGRVKSLERDCVTGRGGVQHLKERFLNTDKKKTGYFQVCLFKNGVRKYYLLHRLVAQAFIPNPLNLPEVNHKDENPANNAVWNLEWCDSSYNKSYGTRTTKANQTQKTREKKRLPVRQYLPNGLFIAEYPGVCEAEKFTGVKYQLISRCCKGIGKQAGGFVWRYA